MHNFVVQSNESTCIKSGRLGLDQVQCRKLRCAAGHFHLCIIHILLELGIILVLSPITFTFPILSLINDTIITWFVLHVFLIY